MKRVAGSRPKVILDEYVLKILNALIEDDLSILNLSKEVNVSYNNLLNKLDFMEEKGLIVKDHSSKGRTVLVRPTTKGCLFLIISKSLEDKKTGCGIDLKKGFIIIKPQLTNKIYVQYENIFKRIFKINDGNMESGEIKKLLNLK